MFGAGEALMTTVRINDVPEVQGLSIQLVDTMARIDEALDRKDRRAFRVWSGRWRSLSGRLCALLLKIATSEG